MSGGVEAAPNGLTIICKLRPDGADEVSSTGKFSAPLTADRVCLKNKPRLSVRNSPENP